MHKLGDQWIEEIDGKEHMVKVGLSMKGEACRGCIYMGRVDECSHPCGCPMKNQFDQTTIIKDLGVLNENGVLPCPFCGEYPKIIHPTENMPVVSIVHTGVGHRILLEFFSSEQEAIDTWNRRAM